MRRRVPPPIESDHDLLTMEDFITFMNFYWRILRKKYHLSKVAKISPMALIILFFKLGIVAISL